MFGPPVTFWTARFESKHRIAKNIAQTAKNVKNITKTLTERQQLRAASVFYSGMFQSDDFTLPQQIAYKKNLSPDTEFHKELASFMNSEDMISSEIIAHGQTYKNGDLIVLKMEDCDEAKVGLIQSILIRKGKVYFICKVYHCIRQWLQYFESQGCEEVCSFVESGKIADYKPLGKTST